MVLYIYIYIYIYRLFSTVDDILWKKSIYVTSFPKKYFVFILNMINRNSMESQIHELKNIKSFSSLKHGPKSDKSAPAFIKSCFYLC